MAHHYLVASLPALKIDAASPFTPEDFIASCEAVMTFGEIEDLRRVFDGRLKEARHPFLRAWQARDVQMRNAVARIRTASRKGEAQAPPRMHEGFDVRLEEGVGEAMNRVNPLEREKALDRLRWDILDEMALGDRYGASPVYAFALKLAIVRRWEALDAEEGRRWLDELITRNLEQGTPPQ